MSPVETGLLILVLLVLTGGMYAAAAWVPALGAAVWLVVREPRSRRVLLSLSAGCFLCAAFLWGAPRWAAEQGVRLRDWLTTGGAVLLAVLFAALVLASAWYAVHRADRRWKKRLLRMGAVLCVWAVAVWIFLYLGLISRPERIGEWQGQKVVMQKLTWMETTYDYYAYNGPFLLGEYLGWSEEPWRETQ